MQQVTFPSKINYSLFSQVLVEKSGTGTTKAYYVYGLGLIGRQDATDSSYKVYHFDRRGSAIALTDTTGAITDTYSYAAYGEQLARTGTTDQPFLYNGRDGVMTDGTTGLYYMRARYYNPPIKRFINMDTLLGGIDDGQTLNRYAFVKGRVVDSVDPLGLSADSDNKFTNYSNALLTAAWHIPINQLSKGLINQFFGTLAANSSYSTKALGNLSGTLQNFAGPILSVGYDTYSDMKKHPERSSLETAGRFSLDISAQLLIKAGGIASGGTAEPALSIVYSANRENIQNAILFNSATDWLSDMQYKYGLY